MTAIARGFLAFVLLNHFVPLAVRGETLPKSVLVIEEADANRGPYYTTMFSALRARLYASNRPLSLYIENLDLPFFEGPEYEETLEQFLARKYRDRPIDVVITIGQGALRRAIDWRSQIWSGAAIVFADVTDDAIEARNLPAYVTGRTIKLRLEDMVEAAHAIVPGLEQVVIVGAPFDSQAAIAFKRFANEIPAISPNVKVADLTGLPIAELSKRVSALPEKSAILYTPIYSDGNGAQLLPAEAVTRLAETANRPIIANVETYIDRGAVGGYMLSPAITGDEAAGLALQILDGVQPSQIPVAVGNSLRPVFNWTGLQRWGVDESSLPPGSEIRNRPSPIWRQYPAQTAIVFAVVLLQSLFIVALLYEHRRRRRAELEVRARSNELAHVNRRATAGELSASIAHEVNQPLGAILANTEVCEMLIKKPDLDVQLIEEVLGDIKSENYRASEVIVRLQRLMRRAEPQKEDIELNELVKDVLKFVAGQAGAHEIDLGEELSAEPLRVHADPIQLQQVVMNLILNAIDAICEAASSSVRRVVVRTRQMGSDVAEIAVFDTGPGIAADRRMRMFEPFFTTKPQGMGMGLSIARTIIQAHGGAIRAESRDGGGAVFRVQLPLDDVEGRKNQRTR
ncbi:histidine kinase [Labrys miyagiensis]|uniref:histidine kinase n=1 Tax=Labrys miyagiensis TaxID=346912 RepID=A0ABQ6CMY5_9HYPH|nr:ABC transporter substrate binding protein [Labrys miyagiensis]GLS21691.1 histidine kinase [Labrys miyagiensis]